MKFRLIASALLASALGLASTGSHASPLMTLTISDGLNSLTFNDAGSGSIFHMGALDGWTFNVTTATSSAPDANGNPGIDLNSIDKYSGGGTSTLTFTLVAAGFTTRQGSNELVSQFGGTAANGGSLSASNSLNGVALFSTGSQTGGFGVNNDTPVDATGTYSLGTTVRITQTGTGQSSFDSSVSVPEPGTLGLLGLAMLGLGLARKRKGRSQVA
jgi:hypothetical protein